MIALSPSNCRDEGPQRITVGLEWWGRSEQGRKTERARWPSHRSRPREMREGVEATEKESGTRTLARGSEIKRCFNAPSTKKESRQLLGARTDKERVGGVRETGSRCDELKKKTVPQQKVDTDSEIHGIQVWFYGRRVREETGSRGWRKG